MSTYSLQFCEVAATAVIHPGVELGDGAEVEDFVVVGARAPGRNGGAGLTMIGARAVLRSHSVVYAGVRIGAGFACDHGCLVREGCELGSDVRLSAHCVLQPHVRVGDRVRLESRVYVPAGSVLEDDCWIGPGVTFTARKFGVDDSAAEAPVLVGRGVKVGANAVVLPGVRLGASCHVGAGAVVTQDVPAGAVVVGNPARVVRTGMNADERLPTETLSLEAPAWPYRLGILRPTG